MKTSEVKLCHKCGKEHPVSDFYGRTASADGLQPYCKYCQREWNINNRERVKTHKHHACAEKLRYYKNHYGLDYTLVKGPNDSGKRTFVSFNCLCCGKVIKCSLKNAANNNFKCNDCTDKKLVKQNKPIVKPITSNKVVSLETRVIDHPLHITKRPKLNVVRRSSKPELPSLRTEQPIGVMENNTVKVVFVPIPQNQFDAMQSKRQPKKSGNGFIRWVKHLFSK